jgi:hypothetical protein
MHRKDGWLRLLVVVGLLAAATDRVFAESPRAASPPTTPTSAAAPAPAAPLPTTGMLTGVITARASGKPLVGVRVTAGGRATTTDASGRFSLELPPGDYEVRLAALAYQPTVLKGPHVEAGAITTVNASLNPAVVSRSSANLDVIEVYGEITRASESSQIERRLQEASVAETVSAETIRKLPGGDVAQVAKRVPSVTVVETNDGEKILCVRGLCNRYTIGLVDGALLPSTNPVKRLVPAELFPPEFIDSIIVHKSFLPDLRGNFSGAQIEFEMRDPPEVPTLAMSASAGANSQTTFQQFNTYDSTRKDWVTLGVSNRSIPSDLGDKNLSDLPQQQQYQIARQFHDIWNVDSYDAPPDFGAKFATGNTWGPLGVLVGGLYKNEWRARSEVLATEVNAGNEDHPKPEYQNLFPQNERDRILTRLAGFLTSTLHLPSEHEIKMTAFVARRAMDETLLQAATPENGGIIQGVPNDFTQLQTQLKYLEDQVAFGQLRGGHPIFEWLDVDWRSAISLSSRNEPDTRYLTYQKQGTGSDPPLFTPDSLGGLRLFNETQEWLSDSSVDVTIPFDTRLPGTKVWSGLPAKFKAGWNYSFRSRTFQQRRFRFQANSQTQNLALPAEDLFAPNQIGPGGAQAVEDTLPTDSFDGTERVLAYYGMLELPIVRDRLRLVGGLREEQSTVTLNTQVFNNGDFCDPNEVICPATFQLDNNNLLPGVSLIYSPRDDMNVRFGFAKTVSRPELRELAPTEFPAARGQLAQFGNPSLVQSMWTSYDLRWEWLPSAVDAVSFGAFWKIGKQPIEQTEYNQAGSAAQTWINADETKLLGFEFEGRKTAEFISPKLRGLSLQTNVTYFPISKTHVPTAVVAGLETQQTNTKRGAGDVPGFIVNAALEYALPDTMTARLLYTTAGTALVRAGGQGLPDTFAQRYDQLDAVLQFPLKRWLDAPVTLQLSAENITNDQVVTTQGPLVTGRTTRGVTFGISFSYSH